MMSEPNAAQTVRTKIVGVLIRDARQVRGMSLADCAEAVGCTEAQFEAYESGHASPSLPELELLAYCMAVPLTYFWGDMVLSQIESDVKAALPAAEIAALRHRIIGAQLRQARQQARLEVDDLAAGLGLSPEELSAVELGRRPLPLPLLETAAARLGVPVEHFFEIHGRMGEWDSTQRAFERFHQLSPEMRDFVSRPINEHYLRLAHQLSQMPLDKLRGIATSLLEITY
jgi:transcriptional regulator with XRE-family HTH domain